MNFPMEYPIFQLFFWLVDTAGIGGIAAMLAGGGSVLSYALILRWISRRDEDDYEVYSYPTPAFHHDHEDTGD